MVLPGGPSGGAQTQPMRRDPGWKRPPGLESIRKEVNFSKELIAFHFATGTRRRHDRPQDQRGRDNMKSGRHQPIPAAGDDRNVAVF